MRRTRPITFCLLITMFLGCAGMSPREQRVLSGGAIGAGTGAAIGAVAGHPGAGAAIGGVVGAVGGLLYDEAQRDSYRNQHNSYRNDYDPYRNPYRGNSGEYYRDQHRHW